MHIMKAVMAVAAGKKFLPTDISGLKLWLDASAITGVSDGGTITTWPDMSGNGYDATQATASAKPVFKTNILNGKPVVRANGSKSMFLSSGLDMLRKAPGVTIFAVAKLDAVGADSQYIFYAARGGGDAPRAALCYHNSVFALRYRRLDSDSTSTLSGAAADTDWHIHGALLDFSTGFSGIYIDAAESNTGSPSTGLFSDTSSSAIAIFSDDHSNYRWNGDIAEIIVYNTALSADDIQKINKYLSQKYGIALS